MGCSQWKGDVRDTIAGGEDRGEQREFSESHICGSAVCLNWFLIKVEDRGPPSMPLLDTLGQALHL